MDLAQLLMPQTAAQAGQAALQNPALAMLPATGSALAPATLPVTGETPPAELMPYAQAFEQNPAAQLARPASSPMEVESRKAGWMEVINRIQSNPNLMRAIGFAGASLVQPRQIGQTKAGHLGQAFMVGNSAYELGDYAQNEYVLKMSEEARKEAESKSRIASTDASTERTKLDTDTQRRTQQYAIDRAKLDLDRAKFDLGKAENEEQVAALERNLRKKKAEIASTIPDEEQRKALLAELEASQLKVNEARARIRASNASARSSNASAAIHEAQASEHGQRLEILKNMPEEERKQFLTKTGKYSGTTSALTQQRDLWAGLYDGLKADDPIKKDMTREQFVIKRLTEAKQKDALELLVKAKQAGFSDEEIDQLGLLDMAKESAKARRGTPSAPAADSTITKMVWDPKLNRYVPQLQAPKEPGK
jgi:hypothetical protein